MNLLNYDEATKAESVARERDMATKYKDGVIHAYIQLSTNEYLDAQGRSAAAMTAQAMIAYNETIDRRWRK